MLIHVEVTSGLQREVKAPVFAEQLQHVVEESDTGGNVVDARAFNAEGSANLRLLGITFDGSFPHARLRAAASINCGSWFTSERTATAPSSASLSVNSSWRGAETEE